MTSDPGPDPGRDPSPEPGGLPAPAELGGQISEMEREEVAKEIASLRRKGRRHLLWAFLGVSPGALIPALGLMREGSTGLLMLLGVFVVLTQLFSWGKTERKVEKLKEQLTLPSSPSS